MSFLPVLEIHWVKVDKQTLHLGQWMWLAVFPSLVLRSKRKKATPFFHRQAEKSFVLPFKGTLSSC